MWGYDTRSERLFLVYQSPGKETFDLPDNITTSRRGTLVVCEDGSGDNHIRGLARRSVVRHRPQPPAAGERWRPAFRRGVRAVDVQPQRADPLREHPGERWPDLRDLGPVGAHRAPGRWGRGGQTMLGCSTQTILDTLRIKVSRFPDPDGTRTGLENRSLTRRCARAMRQERTSAQRRW